MEIVAPDPESAARKELAKAAGVACATISSEASKDAGIVIWGGGSRVRVYCVFDEDAITGDGVNEDPLPKSATEGDWRMSIPCPPEDIAWSSSKLATVSSRISVRSLEEDVDDEQAKSAAITATTIKLDEFLKP
ncbi:MAG: hypothetical protein ACLQU2_28330 [Candidatus Binataceae bacterium]